MNIFTNLLFIFIFVYIALYCQFPNINNDSYIFHKFIIFILLFCFQFIVQLLIKVKNKCKININRIISKSMIIALLAVVGYSVYIDLNYMDYTKNYFESFAYDPKLIYLMATIMIILFISLYKIIETLFNVNQNKCTKYN